MRERRKRDKLCGGLEVARLAREREYWRPAAPWQAGRRQGSEQQIHSPNGSLRREGHPKVASALLEKVEGKARTGPQRLRKREVGGVAGLSGGGEREKAGIIQPPCPVAFRATIREPRSESRSESAAAHAGTSRAWRGRSRASRPADSTTSTTFWPT